MDQNRVVEEVQVVLEVVRKHGEAVVVDLEVDGGDEVVVVEVVLHSIQDAAVEAPVHHTRVVVVVQKGQAGVEEEVVQKGLVVVGRVGSGVC